jgi:glycosyltransferase involved in cell wall biosynthesis
MRICQINSVGYEAGGAEKSVRLVRDELLRRGHEVLVIATDAALGDRTPFADITVPNIRGSAAVRLRDHFWWRRGYAAVRAATTRFAPDVVHLHTIGEFSPSVVAAVRPAPIVFTAHGPEDFTLDLLPWHLPAAAYRDASYRSRDLTPAGRARYAYLRYLQRPAFRFALRGVDRILAPSDFMARTIATDLPAGRIHRLPNGIALPSAQPATSEPRVLYVGRLESVKGVDVLLRAFATVSRAIPGARLEIVGDGSGRDRFVGLAEALGIAGTTHFAGWLSGEALLEAYGRAAVVAVPSVWPENFPTVALEALGVGRPLVGSAIGGLPELIEDGVNGLIVPAGDDSALAAALRVVLGDPSLAAAMGEAARRRAADFDRTRFVDALEEHYTAVGGESR